MPEILMDGVRVYVTDEDLPIWPLSREQVRAIRDRGVVTSNAVVDAVIEEEDVVSPPPLPQMQYLDRSSPGYAMHLRNAFTFFRRHARNPGYSSGTLMRLLNAADSAEASTDRTNNLPVLTISTAPVSYDEDTEVKSGGMVGALVTWPDGKSLLAVESNSRRKGIARDIFHYHSSWSIYSAMYFWV